MAGKEIGKSRTSQLIDIKGYDKNKNMYLTSDGNMELVQIVAKDLVNSSMDEVEYDCLRFAKLYKVYEDDLKIICMNYPCDTEKQQEYYRYKLSKTTNEIHRQGLQQRLDELIWLGKNDTTREYYYMVFAKNEEQMEKNRMILTENLGTGKNGLIQILPEEKKHQIMGRMANKSSLLG